MDAPYQAAADVHVLPANLTLPGTGVLPINAYVLLAEEPVLIDTGIGGEGSEFVDALASIVDPRALRWVWLTHDDADHTGSIQRVFEVAPHARLATHGFSALRMSSWWPVPLDRVHAIRVGDRLPVGDRTLLAVPPPLYDNPLSTGFLDEATGALFSVDSFGAVLPRRLRTPPRCQPTPWPGGCRRGRRRIRRGPICSIASDSVRCSTGCAACSPPASSPHTSRPLRGRRWKGLSMSWNRCPTLSRPSPPATRSSPRCWLR